MTVDTEDVVKFLIAILIGGLIGAERKFRDKSAGFRTIIFITVGATLFTILSAKLSGKWDPGRIAAQIVTGVGFLGAGVILRDRGRVMGITTASTIWMAAALGMGIGAGEYALCAIITAGVLVVLWGFPIIEGWIDGARDNRTYKIVCPNNPDKSKQLEKAFRGCGLHLSNHRKMKSGADMICIWDVHGPPVKHEQLMTQLLADEDVKEIET
ncbi:MgtC/SapB family protein [Desulfobulbus sp. AH-315-M07]|nr:MgtC/SapB family protein [Desulfobulbus sp. AH-315-M07]